MSTPDIRRYALLGDSGFIGRRLKERLIESGAEVHGYSSRDVDLLRPEALSTLDEVVGPETCLILLAGLTPDKGMTVKAMAANVAMASNVAQYLEQRPVGQCVYFSSDAVYEFQEDPVSEETQVDLPNLYAVAKYTGERALQAVAAAQGFPLLILRPTGVFGPGDTHNSYGPNRFVKTVVSEGKVSIFGAGEETRDHVYLDDAVDLTLALAGAGAAGVFNVVSGESRTFGSIVEDLKRVASKPFEVVQLPRSGGAITHRQYDASRIRKALPDFRFTPFQQALKATYEAAATQ